KGIPLYSLGIVKGDLRRCLQEYHRAHVGEPQAAATTANATASAADWREPFKEGLTELADSCRNPEQSAMYRELDRQLRSLTFEDAMKRVQEIENEHLSDFKSRGTSPSLKNR